jgi:hypothetical protein
VTIEYSEMSAIMVSTEKMMLRRVTPTDAEESGALKRVLTSRIQRYA